MKRLHTRRLRLCGLAAGGLLVAGLPVAALPAHALPVFTTANMDALSNGVATQPAICTIDQNPSPDQDELPVVENGQPTTVATNVSGTVTSNADSSDVVSFSTQSTLTGRVTSDGGNPGVVKMTSTGRVQTAMSKPTSACRVQAFSRGSLNFAFDVARGGFMSFTAKASRHTTTQIAVADVANYGPYLDWQGSEFNLSGSTRVYLAPGSYYGYFRAYSIVSPSPTALPSAPTSVEVTGSFDEAGSRTEPVSGKGRKYVTFAGARTCGSNSLRAAVTDKAKRANQIRKVTFFVNGAKGKSLTAPRKGERVRLRIAAEADADIRAEVTLDPVRTGRKPRTYVAEVGYIACL